MEKIINFLKSKSVGYYIACGIALFSLIVGIVFFATYHNPDLDPIAHHNPMGNKADSLFVETIGIFLFAGAAVELAVLLIPQFRFLQIGAVAMFGFAFYKDVMVIPDFIAGKLNNVEYNGGNFNLNMFFFISILIILILSIVVVFLGFYKKEEDGAAEIKDSVKSPISIARVGAGAIVAVAAILLASLASSGVFTPKVAEKQVAPKKVIPPFEPITEAVRAKAEAFEYAHKPEEVVIKQQATYDYSAVSSLPTNGNRTGDHYYVYYFEGAYAEGYQGDYSETYASMYLWEDGVYAGTIGSTEVRGYWYNSSNEAPEDDATTEDVNESIDCLNLVSNVSKYESIITKAANGFYDWRAHVYLGFSWGTRSMEITGYLYYPDVALAIDTSTTGTEFTVGEAFDRSGWVANRILKNLKYSAVFKGSEVTWKDPQGMLEGGKFKAAGEYEITATWNGLTASATVTVTE